MMSSKLRGLDGIPKFPATKQRSSLVENPIVCLILIVTSLLTGCTTMQPMADNAKTLRDELRSGESVKPGDKIRVVTRDGLSRLLIVTALDQNTLKGHPEGAEMEKAITSIPIDDIVYMQGEKVSAGKTATATGGVGVGIVAALFMALIIAFGMPP